MFTTISLAVLLLISIGLFVLARRSKRYAIANAAKRNAEIDSGDHRGYSRPEKVEAKPFAAEYGFLPTWLALIPLVLFLVWGYTAVTTTVDAKTEGVLLTFKNPSDRVLDSGLHLKAPWQKVVEVDGTRKTDNFNDGKPNDEDDPTQDHSSVDCRFGDNGVGKIKASISWSVNPGQSNRVYEEYRDEDPAEKMREDLVVPRFRDALNQVCGTYAPTGQIDALDIDFTKPEQALQAASGLSLAPDFEALSAAALEVVKAKFDTEESGEPLVKVINVSVSYLELPGSAQDKITRFQAEVEKTRIALQSQATNTAQAEANRILADSLSQDPFVLVARCFDLIEDGKLVLPAGGTCWNNAGSAVVIPSAPTPNEQ